MLKAYNRSIYIYITSPKDLPSLAFLEKNSPIPKSTGLLVPQSHRALAHALLPHQKSVPPFRSVNEVNGKCWEFKNNKQQTNGTGYYFCFNNRACRKSLEFYSNCNVSLLSPVVDAVFMVCISREESWNLSPMAFMDYILKIAIYRHKFGKKQTKKNM